MAQASKVPAVVKLGHSQDALAMEYLKERKRAEWVMPNGEVWK